MVTAKNMISSVPNTSSDKLLCSSVAAAMSVQVEKRKHTTASIFNNASILEQIFGWIGPGDCRLSPERDNEISNKAN
jgi:hypothetical protein